MKKIKVMHFVAGLTSGGVEQMLWAKKTLECSTKNRNIDITALKEKYDIKEKAKMLDRYYCQALSRGKVITDVSKKA